MKSVTTLLVLVFSLSVVAQPKSVITTTVPEESNISLQPMLGYATGNFAGASATPKNGLSGGLLVDLGKSSLRFQTGFLYLKGGGEFSEERTGHIGSPAQQITFRWKTNLDLAYLAIPLLGKFAIGTEKSHLYFKAGVSPAILVSSTSDRTFYDGSSQKENITLGSSFDAMATFGLGVCHPISKDVGFIADLSYFRGLSNIQIKEDSAPSLFNSIAMMSAGVSF